MDNLKKQNENTDMPSLKIVRKFDVAPQVVFDALTSPEAMRVWWTDDTTFEVNLRVGGHYKITRKEGDETFIMEGDYLEIKEPNYLKYTIAMFQFSPNSDVISVKIEPEGHAGSVVTFEQTGTDIAAELRDLPTGTVSQSEEGWQQGFDLMEAAWEKVKGE